MIGSRNQYLSLPTGAAGFYSAECDSLAIVRAAASAVDQGGWNLCTSKCSLFMNLVVL